MEFDDAHEPTMVYHEESYYENVPQAPVMPAPRTQTGSVVSQHSVAESAAKSHISVASEVSGAIFLLR